MSSARVSLALLVIAAACAGSKTASQDTTAAATPANDRATKAAAVSNAIAANPAGADSILKANGYTREQFQKDMYAIAADSAQSAAYAAAKTK